MTILESLTSYSDYTVPENTLGRIVIDRGLMPETIYTSEVAKSQNYQLAKADVYMYLYTAPDISELDVSFSIKERNLFYREAQRIYNKYKDDTSENVKVIKSGFIGENFNNN